MLIQAIQLDFCQYLPSNLLSTKVLEDVYFYMTEKGYILHIGDMTENNHIVI